MIRDGPLSHSFFAFLPSSTMSLYEREPRSPSAMAELHSVPLRPLALTPTISISRPVTPTSSTHRLLDVEEGGGATPPSRPGTPTNAYPRRSVHSHYEHVQHVSAWHRFCGSGQRVPTMWESFKSLRSHTSVNLLFVFLPLAWASHMVHIQGHEFFGAPERFVCAYETRADHVRRASP